MNNEEQLKVLQMVSEGIVTVEEGEKLLEALENASQSEMFTPDKPYNGNENIDNGAMPSKMEKKYDKEYKKKLKRINKLAEKQQQSDLLTTRLTEKLLTKAADKLAQKSVEEALKNIKKQTDSISKSFLDS